MASYGRPAFSGRSSVPFARHSQPTGIPRPHQWLLMGVQACRLPAPKPLKPSKPSKRSKPLKPSKPLKNTSYGRPAQAIASRFAANRHPKATSMASYGRPSLPFASPETPKTLQTLQTPKKPFLWASSAGNSFPIRSQQASQGHINGFLWASKLAVCQPLNP